MRILIATGVYPPEIGGPAYYAKSLAEALSGQGHEPRVVLYGSLKRWPIGLRHFLYACKVTAAALRADAIIAFDTFAVGLPAVLAHMLTRKPLIIRIGGDAVWEMYVRHSGDLVPLPQLYEKRERWGWRERAAFRVTRFVVRRARVVFSSRWQLDIWKSPYFLRDSHAHVVANAIPPREKAEAPGEKNFILYSRPIALKNIPAFSAAFAKAKMRHPDISLETGVLPHEKLMERMRSCYAVVLPSISDITPNYISDAIRFGKPFLITKYSAYAATYGEYGVVVDPLSEDDMRRGVEALADAATYERLRTKLAAFDTVRTYDDIAKEFIALLK